MEFFSPFPIGLASFGGLLIGLSAVLLLAVNGRIAGICGIAFSLMRNKTEGKLWRLLFITGLLAGTILWHQLSGSPYPPPPNNEGPWLIIAGLLVGYGTAMSNGCTSGHGICGLARFSLRSFIATLCFMACAIATLTLLKHGLGVEL